MGFLRLFEKSAYILAYPLTFLVMNNSHRTRVIVYCQGEVLVLRTRLNLGDWMLPGGGIKRNETAKTAAARELREETGIFVEQSALRKVGEKEVVNRKIKLRLTFFALKLDTKPALNLHKTEISAAKWARLSRLQKIPMHESERREALALIAKS